MGKWLKTTGQMVHLFSCLWELIGGSELISLFEVIDLGTDLMEWRECSWFFLFDVVGLGIGIDDVKGDCWCSYIVESVSY